MAKSKSLAFSAKDQEIADIAKALAHPARVAILKVLAKKGACMCGEIVEVIPLAQSTVSQHLKELKRAGIIEGEIEGVKSCYCINGTVLSKFSEVLDALFRDVEKKYAKSCC